MRKSITIREYVNLASNHVLFFGPAYRDFQIGLPRISAENIDVVAFDKVNVDLYLNDLKNHGFYLQKVYSHNGTFICIDAFIISETDRAESGLNLFIYYPHYLQLVKNISNIVDIIYSADVNRLYGPLIRNGNIPKNLLDWKFQLLLNPSNPNELDELKENGFTQLSKSPYFDIVNDFFRKLIDSKTKREERKKESKAVN